MTSAAKKITAIELIDDQIVHVPLDLIDPDPNQPRKDFDEDWLKELGADIKQNGLDNPVLLRNHPTIPGRFMLFDGENRVRACRIIKADTIKALPYKMKKGKDAELALFLGQFKTTTHRRDLNAMEYAGVIDKLMTAYKMTQTKVEETFKKYKIANYSRSQIANLALLNRLPDWAKDLIRTNALNRSHGKHLVSAMASDKVMTVIKNKFNNEDGGWQPSEKELQQEIYFAFLREHTELSHMATFDHAKTCKACKKKKDVSNFNGSKTTVCMDRQCFSIFQAEAEKAKDDEPTSSKGGTLSDLLSGDGGAQGPAELTFDEEGHVDTTQLNMLSQSRPMKTGNFDQTECQKCQFRKTTFNKDEYETDQKAGDDVKREDYETEHCFHPKCYDIKTQSGTRALRAATRLMADTIAKRLADEPALATRLMVWVASGCPAGATEHDDAELETLELLPIELHSEPDFEALLFKRSLTSPSQFLVADDLAFVSLAEYAVHMLSEDDYKELIKALKIEINDFQADEIYIASLTARDMLELIGQTELPIAIGNEFDGCAKLESKELRDLMFKHIKHFKAPAKDIQHAFQLLLSEEDES